MPPGRQPTGRVAIALLAVAASLGAGCGTADNSLSSAQIKALTVRSSEFAVGLGGAKRGLDTCVSEGGDTQQRGNCVARVMDDAASHVRDLASYTEGVMASANGACKSSLKLFTNKLSAQASVFSKSGELARSQQIPAFKKTISAIDGPGVARMARGVEKACG